jgi:selenide, water dikinase
MGPCDLQAVFDKLPTASGEFARLLETRDDAAVTQVADDLCLVQTVDFFTPIVDDPYTFGAIAAANALSDVYAMGARPLTAMNLVAWPPELGADVLAQVLRGGLDKVAESGAEMAGGHSIEDKEPKYGLAVTGVAKPSEIVYNAGARPGDGLVLTKPLGIGVLASALKDGVIGEDAMRPAAEKAATLNASAAAAMKKVGAHACTDVSGFGLAGHLGEMLDASGVSARLRLEDVPVHDGVLELIARSVYAGGLRANRDYVLPRFGASMNAAAPGGPASDVAPELQPRVMALFDPQTSGGLLIAVAREKLAWLLAELEEAGASGWTIGEVGDGPAGSIALA